MPACCWHGILSHPTCIRVSYISWYYLLMYPPDTCRCESSMVEEWMCTVSGGTPRQYINHSTPPCLHTIMRQHQQVLDVITDDITSTVLGVSLKWCAGMLLGHTTSEVQSGWVDRLSTSTTRTARWCVPVAYPHCTLKVQSGCTPWDMYCMSQEYSE